MGSRIVAVNTLGIEQAVKIKNVRIRILKENIRILIS